MHAKSFDAAVEFGLAVLAGMTGTWKPAAAVIAKGRGARAVVRVSTTEATVEVSVFPGRGDETARMVVRGLSVGFAGAAPVAADASMLAPGEAGWAMAALRKLAWGWRSITLAGPLSRMAVVHGGETLWLATN